MHDFERIHCILRYILISKTVLYVEYSNFEFSSILVLHVLLEFGKFQHAMSLQGKCMYVHVSNRMECRRSA